MQQCQSLAKAVVPAAVAAGIGGFAVRMFGLDGEN